MQVTRVIGCVTSASMRRDAMLNIRLPLEVKNALHRAAEADHGRSASSMAVRIFREWLSSRGFLPELEASPPEPEKTRTSPASSKGRRR